MSISLFGSDHNPIPELNQIITKCARFMNKTYIPYLTCFDSKFSQGFCKSGLVQLTTAIFVSPFESHINCEVNSMASNPKTSTATPKLTPLDSSLHSLRPLIPTSAELEKVRGGSRSDVQSSILIVQLGI